MEVWKPAHSKGLSTAVKALMPKLDSLVKDFVFVEQRLARRTPRPESVLQRVNAVRQRMKTTLNLLTNAIRPTFDVNKAGSWVDELQHAGDRVPVAVYSLVYVAQATELIHFGKWVELGSLLNNGPGNRHPIFERVQIEALNALNEIIIEKALVKIILNINGKKEAVDAASFEKTEARFTLSHVRVTFC